MKKIQQEYQVNILKYHKGKLLYSANHESGFKTISSETFSSFVLSNDMPDSKDVGSFSLLKDFDYLERKFVRFDEELRKVNKNLLVFIKKRTEQIETQGMRDQRSYQFIRVVVRKFKATPLVEESYPENLDVDDLVAFVEKIVQSEMKEKNDFEKRSMELFRENVMLSPQAAGFFVHETIGHLLEEDIYQYFKEKLASINFPENFFLYDDPTGYEYMIGMNEIDDYGQKISFIPLIKNRKIVNHIRISEGFARAENIDYKPLARMRMLILDNAIKGNVEKVRASKIYVSKIHAGQVIPANFTFTLKGEGTVIDFSGKRKQVKKILLSGNLKEAIESIFFIGTDQKAFSADCTKSGQTIRVGSKSPSIGFVCGKVSF
jgi:predicted Zn-dependent protease